MFSELACSIVSKSLCLAGRVRAVVEKPDFDATLVASLTEMAGKPEGSSVPLFCSCPDFFTLTMSFLQCFYAGMLINTFAPMFGGVQGLVPMLKPMIIGFTTQMGSKVRAASFANLLFHFPLFLIMLGPPAVGLHRRARSCLTVSTPPLL